MQIKLVKPTVSFKEKALEFRKEFFDNGEMIINGSELLDKINTYEEWLKSVTDNTNADTVNPNWVITDTFLAIDSSDNIVGIIDFRHSLNDFLTNFGHCGYSVRPTERRKGVATEILKQLLDIAKNSGMSEIQLSVEKSNIPSIKTIVKNGGVYEKSFDYENELADIYKITL